MDFIEEVRKAERTMPDVFERLCNSRNASPDLIRSMADHLMVRCLYTPEPDIEKYFDIGETALSALEREFDRLAPHTGAISEEEESVLIKNEVAFEDIYKIIYHRRELAPERGQAFPKKYRETLEKRFRVLSEYFPYVSTANYLSFLRRMSSLAEVLKYYL